VIKERLLHQDEGAEDLGLSSDGEATKEDDVSAVDEIAEAPTGLQMSLEEMSTATGIDRDTIKELEAFGIISTHGPEGARYYDGDDFIILSIVKDFLRYGIEARHLTMYKHFADRESSFFDQIIAPTLRQKNPDARRTAAQTLAHLSATSRKFKQALLRTNLREHLRSA
jgi:DNA-binding transcriptional MerR regulator